VVLSLPPAGRSRCGDRLSRGIPEAGVLRRTVLMALHATPLWGHFGRRGAGDNLKTRALPVTAALARRCVWSYGTLVPYDIIVLTMNHGLMS
jgi:hypothetical protein